MMNSLITFDMAKSLQVKNENSLPKHITFEQFKEVRDNLITIDQILWGLLWETGGRISAVLSIRWVDINIDKKELILLVQKKKKHTTIRIPLSNAMVSDLKNEAARTKPKNEDFMFKSEIYKRKHSMVGRLTRQGAYSKVKMWGDKYLNMKIHPHMLRHGLAIYLLREGVQMHVIAARLGHSNVFITQKSYLVITPELQRQMTEHVPMR